ncbi:hypothetical protein TWF696_001468 [Orbilia brochopaga]|uniref:Uncharacterized protein n=1 Tax=Orbilia brochopaga TaxID=3140254 RepID=A0AAV9U9I9_9PEZI
MESTVSVFAEPIQTIDSVEEDLCEGERCFQAANYKHDPHVIHFEAEWQIGDEWKPVFRAYDHRTPMEIAREDKIDGRARGGRGVSGVYTLYERNFILASRQAYGSDGGHWAETAEGLAAYMLACHPDEFAEVPLREKRSISERWHQKRKETPITHTLEHTWRELFDTEFWELERQKIRDGGYLKDAKYPADWEDRSDNASYKKH